jgi:hypothetical protein
MKSLGKWLFLIGLLIAVVVGLFGLAFDWLTWILILLGVLSAVFYFDYNDVVNSGIRYLVLFAVAGAFDSFIAVGPYLTAIFTAVLGFYGPVVLTLLVIWFFKKHVLK